MIGDPTSKYVAMAKTKLTGKHTIKAIIDKMTSMARFTVFE